MGTRTQKRGDRRRSRTLGRINRGDGDGGEPVRSPSGRSSFHWPDRLRWRVSVRHPVHAGTPAASRPPWVIQQYCRGLARIACKTSRIHKPSAVVSFGLPDPLSFLVRGRAMVAADRGQTSTGKASGSGCKRGLTRHLKGMQCLQSHKGRNARNQRRVRGRPMRHRRYRWPPKT